jgi:hypothetical protein
VKNSLHVSFINREKYYFNLTKIAAMMRLAPSKPGISKPQKALFMPRSKVVNIVIGRRNEEAIRLRIAEDGYNFFFTNQILIKIIR